MDGKGLPPATGLPPAGELLNTAQAAERVCLSARTLERLRAAGKGPKYLRIGRWIRYRAEDLDKWLESRARGD